MPEAAPPASLAPSAPARPCSNDLLAKHSAVDIVIVVACGERAGEVVETITEFPQLRTRKTGGSLMDRTIIICNTSSMPVAAREASIYTGITLGEYYRQMGSSGAPARRFAPRAGRRRCARPPGGWRRFRARRPSPPIWTPRSRGLYERAGVIRAADGAVGSLTLIGSVSPAGGNFEEPVTQSTLGTVKCFLGLSYDRAYKRFYPAIDPLISWSRYLDQLAPWYERHLDPTWDDRVRAMQGLLTQGDAVKQMMQVTGEEGITSEDYVVLQKALLLDMVFLQQDAFDPVDASVPMDRQRQTFDLLHALTQRSDSFADKAEVRQHFTRLTNLFKNFNYAATGSPDHARLLDEIQTLADPMANQSAASEFLADPS